MQVWFECYGLVTPEWIHEIVGNLGALGYPEELVCLLNCGIFAHKGHNPFMKLMKIENYICYKNKIPFWRYITTFISRILKPLNFMLYLRVGGVHLYM